MGVETLIYYLHCGLRTPG